MNPVNKYNPIIWASGETPDTDCSAEYSFPHVTGDTVSFYINFDTPISSDITNWQLGIWIPDNAIVIPNIATINKDDIDGVNFNIYASLVLGAMPGPWFRLVISDIGDSNRIKYWSSPFHPQSSSDDTIVLKYRNSFNQMNFYYENITTFYNQVRINAILAEPIPVREVTGYKTTSGHFVNAKSVYKKSKLLKTLFLDELAHDGISAMIHHDEIYFDLVRYYSEDNNYEIENIQAETEFWNGSVRLFLYDYTLVASNT